MVDESRSDTELVKAFQRGDARAFDQFVARHQSRVFRLALVWLYDASMAADATQEVFLRAITGLRTFLFAAEPFTWLYRTQRLVCHEFNRRRQHETLADEPQSTDPTAADTLDAQRIATTVRSLVADLPERQREVVVLRIFEALSVRDTARAMGCREGTVKALLNKAKASLRRRWEST
ncbi:MAG: RNA polymerase sigma factor [Pseudomonadota bacterium]